ncbi:MAG: WD40 repeat domain-containing protein [Bacteroidota bacterium]
MKFRLTILLLLLISTAYAQQYENFQLRLEPVWSRVADALGEAGSVESAEFSPDGKYIVSGTKYDNSVVMWRTSDGTELWRQYAAQEIERVGWSADGKYVAACSEDFLVTVYESATGKVFKELKHTQGIDGLTWSNTGLLLVSGEEMTKKDDGSTSGFIRVFELPSGKEISKIDFGSTINELFFSHDDKYLLAVGHDNVRIYNTKNWSLNKTLTPGYKVKYVSGVFSPDSKYVFATGGTPQIRGELFLWEVESGKLIRKFNHTGKKVESVTWHPNGQYLAFAGHDPHIYVYRTAEVMKYKNDNIRIAHKVWASDNAEYIDFNADGSFLVSAHQNGLIKLWAWMGEDPDLNSKLHKKVKKVQSNYVEKVNK